MTQEDKKKALDQWWIDNWHQLWINVHKCLGHSPVAISKWGEDLRVWSYEQFSKKTIDRQYEILEGGKLEMYITSGMAIAIKSSSSPFYRHYRKFSRQSATVNNQSDYQGKAVYKNDYAKLEDKENKVREALNTLDFYERYLIQEYYYKDISTKKMAKSTGINPATISRDIKKALHKLKLILDKTIEL